MKNKRERLIEAIVAGDRKEIIKNTPEKYMFALLHDEDADGPGTFELQVIIYSRGKNPIRYERRKGKGDFRQALTPDENEYWHLCGEIGRICFFTGVPMLFEGMGE